MDGPLQNLYKQSSNSYVLPRELLTAGIIDNFLIAGLPFWFKSRSSCAANLISAISCNEEKKKKINTFDLSIALTKTKYIKLNTKTQNIFCRLNENLMTFLYTLTGATRKQKKKKKFSLLKCIQKSNVIKKKEFGF